MIVYLYITARSGVFRRYMAKESEHHRNLVLIVKVSAPPQ